MNTLRVRIAVILIASISLVVCLATVVLGVIGQRNAREDTMRPVAGQIVYFVALAQRNPNQDFVRAGPVLGIARQDLLTYLQDILRRGGHDWPIVIAQPSGAAQPFASVEISPSRWVTLPIPEGGPPSAAWFVLAGWMLLIFIGTTGVSLVVAHRVTRPLVLLEHVAARIGASGQLEPVPEGGPAEVRATARALNQLSRNLRTAIESRMRLVAAAGHDLRTPLTRMRLRAEFLDEGERGKWLANIEELERIAESAIALVREEAGHRDTEAIRLDEMAKGIADDITVLDFDVTLAETIPVEIEGPPLALLRALRNLAMNAATHGGGATLSVSRHDGQAVLTVEDDGPGIPDALIGRVFEPFFRADLARRQATPGAGLGLAIAREIIQRAGGTLTLANRPSGGLRQVVAFPAKPMNEAAVPDLRLTSQGARA